MINYSLCTKPPKPSQLTEELRNRLTEEFKNSGKDVWNKKWLKKAILEKTFGKCCYSDIKLNDTSRYMEVEHFLPKSIYPEFVMEWDNLMPSCKHCNTKKGNHDPKKEPIVNPFQDDPHDYLYIIADEYCGKNEIGKKTVKVLGLNDEILRNHRADLVVFYKSEFDYLYINKTLFFQLDSKHLIKLKNLLKSGNREKEYAILASTIILEDSNYKQIETFLRDNNLWDEDLQTLKSELEFCSLPQITYNS